MFKDHKIEGGYRPVVSGCNSDSLGLGNTLSEVVESVCMGVENPYEVISSEDLLSRIHATNRIIEEKIQEKNKGIEPQIETEDTLLMFSEFWYQIENKWCWTDEYVILGTLACFRAFQLKRQARQSGTSL